MSTKPNIIIPDVTDEDKANIVAYNLAKRRLANIMGYRYNSNSNADADKLVMFTLGRNAKRANKLILNAMVKDIMVEANMFLIKDKAQSWEIITSDAIKTTIKVKDWADYLGIKDNLYTITDPNARAHNYLIKVNCYRREDSALLEMNSTFYGKNGKTVKSMDDRISAVYQHGYLMHKRRNAGVVRPNTASRQDIDFMNKMIDFMSSITDPPTTGGVRTDIRNTMRRFCSNYEWPGKKELETRLKPSYLSPRPK